MTEKWYKTTEDEKASKEGPALKKGKFNASRFTGKKKGSLKDFDKSDNKALRHNKSL